jgi:hypothetical protein
MHMPVLSRHKIQRLARLALVTAFGAVALACSTPSESRSTRGELELSVVGVTDQGTRYRVQGSFNVSGLDNGLHTLISSDENPRGAVVRRPLPPGLYSVALNPGFELEPLTNGSNTPAPATQPLRFDTPAWYGPRLVIVESDKVAQVQIQSFTPNLQSERPLAQADPPR